ncbi:MAG: hypothetical protein QME54_06420 [Actinomycetota bacterium]|nr:hypothetical protein [Actinomycetota bacterium]
MGGSISGILKKKSGLSTIAELVIGSAIMILVIFSIYALFYSGIQTEKLTRTEWDIQRESQKALDDMSNEIRGAAQVLDAQSDRIVFKNTSDVIVRYYLSGTNLMRIEGASYSGGVVKLEDVSSFQLSYYDSNNNQTWIPSSVEAVKISLTVTRSSDPACSISLISRVKLRN